MEGGGGHSAQASSGHPDVRCSDGQSMRCSQGLRHLQTGKSHRGRLRAATNTLLTGGELRWFRLGATGSFTAMSWACRTGKTTPTCVGCAMRSTRNLSAYDGMIRAVLHHGGSHAARTLAGLTRRRTTAGNCQPSFALALALLLRLSWLTCCTLAIKVLRAI